MSEKSTPSSSPAARIMVSSSPPESWAIIFHADKDAIEPVGGGSAFDAEIRAVAVEDSAFGVVNVIPKPHDSAFSRMISKPCGKAEKTLPILISSGWLCLRL